MKKIFFEEEKERAHTEQNLTRFLPIYNSDRTKKVEHFFRQKDGGLLVPRFYKQYVPTVDPQMEWDRPHATLPLFTNSERPQTEIVAVTLEQIRKAGGATMVVGCGGGKTNMAIAIGCALNGKIGVIVHKDFLIRQWKERIEAFCTTQPSIGIIKGKKCTDGHFVLISVKSLAGKREYPPELLRFRIIITDECHHMPANTFLTAMSKLTSDYLMGLTATPTRKDKQEDVIYMMTGPVSFVFDSVPSADLVIRSVIFRKQISPKLANYVRLGSMLSKDLLRNKMIAKMIVAYFHQNQDEKCLVLSGFVSHCVEMRKLIPDKISSDVVTGEIKTTPNNEISFKNFVTFSTFSLLSEGVDLPPDVRRLFIVTPVGEMQQTSGRLRHGGVVIDIMDKGVLEDNGMLMGLAMKRRRFYSKRGYKVTTEEGADI